MVVIHVNCIYYIHLCNEILSILLAFCNGSLHDFKMPRHHLFGFCHECAASPHYSDALLRFAEWNSYGRKRKKIGVTCLALCLKQACFAFVSRDVRSYIVRTALMEADLCYWWPRTINLVNGTAPIIRILPGMALKVSELVDVGMAEVPPFVIDSLVVLFDFGVQCLPNDIYWFLSYFKVRKVTLRDFTDVLRYDLVPNTSLRELKIMNSTYEDMVSVLEVYLNRSFFEQLNVVSFTDEVMNVIEHKEGHSLIKYMKTKGFKSDHSNCCWYYVGDAARRELKYLRY